MLGIIGVVAPTDATVLITERRHGQGTGRPRCSQRSRRSARAFVTVNCAAIPRDLIASELFGHEKAPSPELCSAGLAASNWLTAEPSSSTKWANFYQTPRSLC